MDFEKFRSRILSFMRESGEPVDVVFGHEDGYYYARFSNGVRVTGNSRNPSMTVRWGSGHVSMIRA